MKKLEQVKEEVISRINDVKGINSRFYHWFNDSWHSTCKSAPLEGVLTKYLKTPVKVSFVNKYKETCVGYLYCVDYDKYSTSFRPIVLIADKSGIISDGFIACSVTLKSLKFTQPFDLNEFISDFPNLGI